jgi:hypothetical protein
VDFETKQWQELLNLNPSGWTGDEKNWRMLYSVSCDHNGEHMAHLFCVNCLTFIFQVLGLCLLATTWAASGPWIVGLGRLLVTSPPIKKAGKYRAWKW